MSFKNVERLSSLPQEIRSHILSLMPTKFAVRTSILSKSWRYSWALVTNLDFDDTHPILGIDSLSKFVERVLNFCKPSHIKLFRLHFSKIRVPKSSVSNWIDKAVRLNVRELDIRVIMLELPLSLFTCKTLTKLRLDRGNRNYSAWECPCPVNLPFLKTLEIVVYTNPLVNAFKLISGCKMLENLSLEVTWRGDEEDYIFNIPTLKQLKLTFLKCAAVVNKVVLNVPNLEYLFVGGVLCSLFVMEDVTSLVDSSVSFNEIRFNLWIALLNGISGAKSLSAQNFPFTSNLPIFRNMKHLELKSFWHYGEIPQILENSPELEHLCIEQPEECCWIEPKFVPTCMRTKLTTMKFSKCKGQNCDTEFLKYMFGNSEILKRITITWGNLYIEEQMRVCAQLLKLPMASRNCEINFIGNWYYSPII